MDPNLPPVQMPAIIGMPGVAQLIGSLQRRGFEVVAPTLRDGAVVHGVIQKLDELPAGWTDEQEAGQYRLQRREDGALFGFAAGAHSWKRFLYPPDVRLCQLEAEGASFKVLAGPPPARPQAFLGVRACDLAAIRILDRVLVEDQYVDPVYQERRRNVFIVAVHCTRASATCFCTSMEAGPRVSGAFDLALTELAGPEGHIFLVETGSEAGAAVLSEVDHREAHPEEIERANAAVEGAARQIGRRLDTTDLRRLLFGNLDHLQWDQVAERCLSCGNCTMVCPTCFCATIEDWSAVAGARAERRRKWDSCFTESFSYIHGGSVRLSVKSRYRQWLTHKLAGWVDQFGAFGCVGCGRCITWCPAGIDITEEVAAIRGDGAPHMVRE